DIGLNATHLAYIIYTSGSTGKPKGVLVEHRNVGCFIAGMSRRLDVETGDRFLQFSSFSFDMFVYEFTMSLCRGATLCIARKGAILAGDYLAEFIKHRQITHATTTPGTLGTLHDAEDLTSLRILAVGGETVPKPLARYWSAGRILLNAYGPTETAVVATAHHYHHNEYDEPSIGNALSNVKLYVLDENQQPVPVGVTGELFIGGQGVARGYLNQPALTAERFLPDPFNPAPNARMYKTGDLVRWRSDGNLDYLGRNDFQVKLRGFRIELGEIEARLLKHEGIREAIVIMREDSPGQKQIVAYYVPADSQKNTLEPAVLRSYLLTGMPDYMVPTAFVCLYSIPLTTNGKINHKALQSPDYDSYAQRNYEAPEGEVEGIIASVWAELLKRDRIGRHDNFFDIGGHSLMLLQTLSRLKRSGIHLNVSDIYKNPTIESAAAHIAKMDIDAKNNSSILLKSGRKPPLFLIHDGSGLLIYAHVLADLIDLDIAIYGLPAKALEEKQIHVVEDMAARLVEMIKAIQPDGDYILAGWSFGGLLAYEVATQLMNNGAGIEFLGMFDTYYQNGRQMQEEIILDEKSHLFALMQLEALDNEELQSALEKLRDSCHDMELHEVIDQANNLKETLTPAHLLNLPTNEISEYLSRQLAFHSAAMEYAGKPIPAQVKLFIAENVLRNDDTTLYLGWDSLLEKSKLDTIKVSGSHYSMMQSPNIEELAKKLADALREASKHRILCEGK
ncbi:MAG: non-ribosomal peptide synthetase, partial [Arenimonas sp.]